LICQSTCKGRVVYNRKKHRWTLKDLFRVSKSLALNIFTVHVPDGKAIEFREKIQQCVLTNLEEYNLPSEFGGGGFGGAGATREYFVKEDEFANGVLFIIEEINGGENAR